MGWTSSFEWKTKKDVIKHVACQSFWAGRHQLLSSSVVGGNLWMLVELTEGDNKGKKFVCLALIEMCGKEYGYKTINEGCLTPYYNCPLKFIRQIENQSFKPSESALAWRKEVKLFHENKKVGELKKNMKVRLYDIEYELIDNLGRKGWSVRSLKDKQIYQMMKKQVLAAKIVE